MKRTTFLSFAAAMFSLMPLAAQAQAIQPSGGARKIYNTVKTKLSQGKTLNGAFVSVPDPNIYCAMANAGFDFTWIEMQHSPLTYGDVAKMLFACRGSSAMPFIRVPDATESEVQKATDIGALGLIFPTVDTAEKTREAVKWAKYPPFGRRSIGAGQFRQLWGSDYRQTANDNIMVIIMIETAIGVENVEQIAAVPGVDMIFIGPSDLASFSGTQAGDPKFEAMVKKVHDATMKAGLKLGSITAFKGRPDFTFFVGGDEASLIKAGAQALLEAK